MSLISIKLCNKKKKRKLTSVKIWSCDEAKWQLASVPCWSSEISETQFLYLSSLSRPKNIFFFSKSHLRSCKPKLRPIVANLILAH